MKNKIVYVSIFLCLAGLAVAAEYTDWQNGAIEGLNKGFMMGQAYQLALDGKNIDDFNAKVDEYNAWVRANFGEDPNMLMPKMTAPVDLAGSHHQYHRQLEGNSARDRWIVRQQDIFHQ